MTDSNDTGDAEGLFGELMFAPANAAAIRKSQPPC
jgi:hypothetical protein